MSKATLRDFARRNFVAPRKQSKKSTFSSDDIALFPELATVSGGKASTLINDFFASSINREILEETVTVLSLRRNDIVTQIQKEVKLNTNNIQITDKEINEVANRIIRRAKEYGANEKNVYWDDVNQALVFARFGDANPSVGSSKRFLRQLRSDPEIGRVLGGQGNDPFLIRGHATSFRAQALANTANTLIQFVPGGREKNNLKASIDKLVRDATNSSVNFEATSVVNPRDVGKTTKTFKVVILESNTANNAKSLEERQIVRQLRNNISSIFSILVANGLDNDELVDLGGSPDYLDTILDSIESPILDIPAKASRVQARLRAKPLRRVRNKQRYRKRGPKFKLNGRSRFNVSRLIAAMNAGIHDVVRENMAESTAPPVRLRYQTGRFARSVKVVNAVQRENAVQVFYTWQKHPYGVFLPGGRLHKPGRNPATIIGRSIRELATEIFAGEVRVIASQAV